jgi:kynureninase
MKCFTSPFYVAVVWTTIAITTITSVSAWVIGVGRPTMTLTTTTTTTTSTQLAAATDAAEKTFKVFIDGEAGTTGLQVRQRLESRKDLEIISPPADLRKDEATRKKLINEADAVILCTLLLLLWRGEGGGGNVPPINL